jgi:hypothetical protein
MKYATFYSTLAPTLMLVAGLAGGAASFVKAPFADDSEVLRSVTESQSRSSCAVAAQLGASPDAAARETAQRMSKESGCKAS